MKETPPSIAWGDRTGLRPEAVRAVESYYRDTPPSRLTANHLRDVLGTIANDTRASAELAVVIDTLEGKEPPPAAGSWLQRLWRKLFGGGAG